MAPVVFTNRGRLVIILFVLFAAIFAVYGELVDHPFHTFDDPIYVTNNYYVQQGLTWNGVAWAFRSLDVANWHPLTWISHMIDVSVFGPKPAGHYLTNIFWHGIATCLLYLLGRRLAKNDWAAFFVAALWAVHPANVECVAWICQRKSLLASAFIFAGLIFYADFRCSARRTYFLLSLLCQILASMAKPVAVLFPVAVLLVDTILYGERLEPVWRESHGQSLTSRIYHLVRKCAPDFMWYKAPFVAVAGYLSVLTFYAQDKIGATGYTYVHGFGRRLGNALESILDYTIKSLTSPDTSVLYMIKALDPAKVAVGLALVAAASLGTIAWFRKHRFVSVGIAWYLLMFLPTIGLVQVGSQRLADRYLHLPLIGLLVVMCYVVMAFFEKRGGRGVAAAILCAWGIALGIQAKALTYVWSDALRLSTNAIRVGGASYSMFMNCSVSEMENNHPKRARHYLEMMTDDAGALNNIAVIDLREGKYMDALRRASILEKKASYRLRAATIKAEAFAGLGRFEEAAAEFRKAIANLPGETSYLLNLEQLRVTLPLAESVMRAQASASRDNAASAQSSIPVRAAEKVAVQSGGG
jgi:protein O-mannosyl-transferase